MFSFYLDKIRILFIWLVKNLASESNGGTDMVQPNLGRNIVNKRKVGESSSFQHFAHSH